MKEIKTAIMMLLVSTLICGGIYPVVVTGIGHAFFPEQASGSFISDKSDKFIGSSLIGQPFTDAKYFWSRPSMTPDFGYNPMASGGSNAGPTNPDYLQAVGNRIKVLRDSGVTGLIPADLVQASASGLDPHISQQAAFVQIPRVSKERRIKEDILKQAIAQATEGRQFGLLGDPRVNVLKLNLSLDRYGHER